MSKCDLCIAWNWEHDADFVTLLKRACSSRGLSLLQATPDNLEDLLCSLAERRIVFKAFFDRASDGDDRFMPLVQWVCDHGIHCINSFKQACQTWDKAALHLLLRNADIHTPYTIIFPPYKEQPVISSIDLKPLGERFTIKPAHGCGGEGVVTEATSLNQVLDARQERATDRYLLQAHIIPKELDSRPAWFRVIYCRGQVYPCWWDPATHIYALVTSAEESCYRLSPLHDIIISIARLCRIDLFSTEIALTSDGLFVVVDYVNDQIDLRLQSKGFDGVPDKIVHNIAEHLVGTVANYLDARNASRKSLTV